MVRSRNAMKNACSAIFLSVISRLQDSKRSLLLQRTAQRSFLGTGTRKQRSQLQCADLEASCFNDQEKAILHFIDAVVAGPTVDDTTFSALRAQVSDRKLVEILGLIGYYWMLGRLCMVLDIDLDSPKGTEVFNAGLSLYHSESAS